MLTVHYRIYEADTLTLEKKILDLHKEDIVITCFSPDDAILATGSKDKHARVFDLADEATEQPIYKLKVLRIRLSGLTFVEAERVYAIDFHPDQERWVACQ